MQPSPAMDNDQDYLDWVSHRSPSSREHDRRDLPRRNYVGDDHVNPLFRPTVQALYNKLWPMKTLKDQDNRVHILARLSHELDIAHLALLVADLQMQLFRKVDFTVYAKERGWETKTFDNVDWPWQWGEQQPQNAPMELELPDGEI